MKRRIMSDFLKKEEGSGLVLALMTLLVLSVLGASLGTITISGFRMSDTNRDSSSAYYIAEAGANMAYEEMEVLVESAYEDSNSQSEFFDTIENNFSFGPYADFEKQFGEKPEAAITITSGSEGESREYTIHSQSNIGNQSREVEKAVSVNWTEKDDGGPRLPTIPENTALVGNTSLYISGNEVNGNMFINSTSSRAVEITYTDVGDSTIFYPNTGNQEDIVIYPDWDNWEVPSFEGKNAIEWHPFIELADSFPKIPSYDYHPELSHIKLEGGVPPTTLNIEENTSFSTIELYAGRTLRIDTDNKDVSIVVDHLNLNNGFIEFIGDGSINMYVKESLTFGASSTISHNSTTSKLSVYYKGSSDLYFSGSQRMNGDLFIKEADMHIQAGSGVTGAILSGGSEINLDGGTSASPLIILPKGTVNLDGGANFDGIVVSDSISLTGGTKVNYQSYNFDDFPFGSSDSGDAQEPNTQDLINSEPVIEAR